MERDLRRRNRTGPGPIRDPAHDGPDGLRERDDMRKGGKEVSRPQPKCTYLGGWRRGSGSKIHKLRAERTIPRESKTRIK